jgi:site-specific DNA recombinase
MKTVRAAIYCRLSKKGGRSVDRQEKDGRRIAAERGWQVAEVFKEEVSASPYAKKARKEWERLLGGIEKGAFDAVILWMEDRSSRDVLRAAEFLKVCDAAGLSRLLLPSFEYDLGDQEHRNRFLGEVVAAEREVIKMSKRVRRALLEAAEDGKSHTGGKRPFGSQGWRVVEDEDGNRRKVRAVELEQARREQELIRDAARRILAGDTLRGIVTDWNAKGLVGAAGERWSTRALKRVLVSPRLAGLRDHHGALYEGNGIDPVLDREQWEQLKAILTDPARRVTAAGGTPRYLLTSLVFCGVCGARMRGSRTRNGTVTYACPQLAEGGRRCVRRNAERVEQLILGALFVAVESPAWDRQAAKRPRDDPSRPHYEALARITADLDVLDGMLAEAELSERQGRKAEPSVATLRRKMADREREREHHEAAAARLRHGRVVAAVPANLRDVWSDFSLDRQRAILAAVIERIDVLPQRPLGPGGFDPDTIEVRWRK